MQGGAASLSYTKDPSGSISIARLDDLLGARAILFMDLDIDPHLCTSALHTSRDNLLVGAWPILFGGGRPT